MKKRQLALILGSSITGIFILFSSCKKINEATDLGGDLIPVVDNINTFDTVINVEAYNDLFTLGGTDPLKEDSTRSIYSDEQFLGLITNDPLFGKTDARMFFELTPPSFPKFTFSNRPDSLHIDSVVLVLNYSETYGDTSISQTVNVYEIDQSVDFRIDTSYLLRQNNFTYSNLLGSRTFKPEVLNDSVKVFQDTTANQLRIRLDDAFGQRLLNYDTAATPGHVDGYSTDSVFKTRFKGFALRSVGGGNAVMGFDLTGANTKLAIYYRDDNGDSPKEDTTVAYFTFSTAYSGSANYVIRDYSGSQLQTAQGGTTPDPFVYIQNTPGSFATIKIPDLAGLNNRVVHRAELIAEQVYHMTDSMFAPPAFLYLDAYTPALSKYRNIPYDVIFDYTNSTYNFNSLGVVPINALDGAGNVVRTWHFNLTRYVQHVVNDTEPLYDLRLFSPVKRIYDQYFPPAAGATAVTGSAIPEISLNPSFVKGRVRLAGGTAGPQRMRLRIVYSKL